MQSNQVGFESSFQQHLDAEQRRAVLEAIGASISPDSTLGEILDAAEALGWSEKMGDLSLADLAEALLAPEKGPASPTLVVAKAEELDDDDELDEGDDELDDDGLEDLDELDDEDLDELDDDEELDDEFEVVIQESSSKRGKAASKQAAASQVSAKKASAKKASSKKASSKKASSKKASSKKASSKKASAKKTSKKAPAKAPPVAKKTSKKAAASQAPAKKAGKRKLTAVDVDDRMSLDQAAEFFLPYVEDLGEATMQALEEQTSVSRRKLRFHVGQLVKHGLLERHGMGRGTYYTKA